MSSYLKKENELDKRTVPFWRRKLICDRNINTKCHFEQKIIENLGQSQRNSKFDERTASLKTKIDQQVNW